MIWLWLPLLLSWLSPWGPITIGSARMLQPCDYITPGQCAEAGDYIHCCWSGDLSGRTSSQAL